MILLLSQDSPERNAIARILRQAGYEVREVLRLAVDDPQLGYPKHIVHRGSH
jgi:hypothetical protein